jgi:hypothetical protein
MQVKIKKVPLKIIQEGKPLILSYDLCYTSLPFKKISIFTRVYNKGVLIVAKRYNINTWFWGIIHCSHTLPVMEENTSLVIYTGYGD